jgi:hypothetical protein
VKVWYLGLVTAAVAGIALSASGVGPCLVTTVAAIVFVLSLFLAGVRVWGFLVPRSAETAKRLGGRLSMSFVAACLFGGLLAVGAHRAFNC